MYYICTIIRLSHSAYSVSYALFRLPITIWLLIVLVAKGSKHYIEESMAAASGLASLLLAGLVFEIFFEIALAQKVISVTHNDSKGLLDDSYATHAVGYQVHITSRHVTSRHVTSRHVTSRLP